MSVQLDRKTALVLIDLQQGIVRFPTVPHPADGVVENGRRLAEGFRARNLPVVLVRVITGPIGPEQAELVLEKHKEDIVVTKHSWGAFINTELDAQLRERGVTTIVLGGIATAIGVESTAREAYDLGYQLIFPEDAMTDRSVETHENSVQKIFPRMGQVVTTDAVLEALKQLD
uniref:Hydrolase n=1 Tax=Thermosporothrix sp. COM3 TaxID=2490863 RepID=A0A455SFS1_9CHLR|nr:hydrolase [Thermosporothrix sp. COM3]